MERYISLLGKHTILNLLADREFTGEPRLSFLYVEKIKYFIRIQDRSLTLNYTNGKRISIKGIFSRLKINQAQSIPRPFMIHGNRYYLSALCFINDKGKRDLLVILSLEKSDNALEWYRERWQIEAMFREFKSSGFNLEDTHLRDTDRFEKLQAIVTLPFT